MIITELRRQRGQLVLLVLDGEPAVTVDARTLNESPYRVGSSLDDEALRALLEESGRRRAREKALYLLSRRDHSREELRRKLSGEAGEGAAEETAARMEELGLVNDEAYARRLARELRLRRHYPRRRTVQELTARGVCRETAEEAADAAETEDWIQALELLRKKYYNRLHDSDGRRKTAAALARQGFGFEDIRRALRAYDENDREKNDAWDIE